MKLYTVSAHCGYEGYDEPQALFTTSEAAQAYIDAMPARIEAFLRAVSEWHGKSDYVPHPHNWPEFEDINSVSPDEYVITELEVRS